MDTRSGERRQRGGRGGGGGGGSKEGGGGGSKEGGGGGGGSKEGGAKDINFERVEFVCSVEASSEVSVEFEGCEALRGVNFERIAPCAFRVETEVTKSLINTTISLVSGRNTAQVVVKPGVNYVNFGGTKDCVDFLVCQVLDLQRVVELESIVAWHAGMLCDKKWAWGFGEKRVLPEFGEACERRHLT